LGAWNCAQTTRNRIVVAASSAVVFNSGAWPRVYRSGQSSLSFRYRYSSALSLRKSKQRDFSCYLSGAVVRIISTLHFLKEVGLRLDLSCSSTQYDEPFLLTSDRLCISLTPSLQATMFN